MTSASASAIPSLSLKSVWATTPDDKKLANSNFVALDASENVYVGDTTNPGVAEFDSTGSFVRRFNFPADSQLPTGIAVDRGGNVYAAEFGGSRIIKFDPAGRILKSWPTLANGPTGVGVDADGHVFVASHRLHDRYVQKFDSEGKLLAEFGTTGIGDGQFRVDDKNPGPEQLAIGRNGHVYVTDSGAYRVIEFDNAGAFVRNYVADAASAPRPLVGVAVDGAGNVYAASGGPIIKWGPDGRVAAHLEPPGGYRAWKPSLAANLGGDLWIAEPGRRNLDGNLIAIVHRMSVSG